MMKNSMLYAVFVSRGQYKEQPTISGSTRRGAEAEERAIFRSLEDGTHFRRGEVKNRKKEKLTVEQFAEVFLTRAEMARSRSKHR